MKDPLFRKLFFSLQTQADYGTVTDYPVLLWCLPYKQIFFGTHNPSSSDRIQTNDYFEEIQP